MNLLLLAIVFILGTCFGSFVNMLVYRTALEYKLEKKKFRINNKNRSFCDYCGRQLEWYENIPIVSWLIIRGKTKCCQKKLPISYPIVEILIGSLFVIQFLNVEKIFLIILGFLVIVLLVFSSVFDLKYMILPDFSTFILIGIAILTLLINQANIIPYLLSALVVFSFLLFLNLITKGKGMGLGDVKLAIFMGLFLGPVKTLVAFYSAFIIGALVGIILIIQKKANKKTAISFGPFLILGTIVAWWWGGYMVDLFNKLFIGN